MKKNEKMRIPKKYKNTTKHEEQMRKKNEIRKLKLMTENQISISFSKLDETFMAIRLLHSSTQDLSNLKKAQRVYLESLAFFLRSATWHRRMYRRSGLSCRIRRCPRPEWNFAWLLERLSSDRFASTFSPGMHDINKRFTLIEPTPDPHHRWTFCLSWFAVLHAAILFLFLTILKYLKNHTN